MSYQNSARIVVAKEGLQDPSAVEQTIPTRPLHTNTSFPVSFAKTSRTEELQKKNLVGREIIQNLVAGVDAHASKAIA